MSARDKAIATGNSDANLEFYIARYLSKEDALLIKRKRRVMGYCSQDRTPRIHAMQISVLAAQTAKWDVFLRAHLDVMNDRFSRMSDGSYAWAGKKTYFKELEELDIYAIDLLLGTCLRVDNVADRHYFGSVSRIGRALSDVEDKDELESRFLEMVESDQLDPYNRLLIAYAFGHYLHNLDDESRTKEGMAKFMEATSTWPKSLLDVWDD